MVASALYVLTTSLLLFLWLRIPKDQSKVVWFPTIFFAYFASFCVIYGILFLFEIGFSIFIAVVANLFLIALTYYFKDRLGISKKNKIGDKKDAIVVCVICVVSVAVYICQFGFSSDINFATSDPAVHLSLSKEIYYGAASEGQFTTHLLAALFMSVLCPFLGEGATFIAFAVSETFLFLLSGWGLYSVLRLIANKLNSLILCVIVLLYVLGYPLNNQIFGFSYLGFAVTVIASVLFILIDSSLLAWQRNTILSLLMLLIILSYSLFVPPVFLAVFLVMCITNRSKNVSLLQQVKQVLIVFAAPVVLGFLIVYSSIFGASGGLTVGGALAIEGGAFRDLYSSFIFIAPISIFGFIYLCQKKKQWSMRLFSVVYISFVLILFIGGLCNAVSSYYFFKTYNALWLIFFVFLGVGVQALKARCKSFILTYSLIWCMLFMLFATGLDSKLSTSRPLFNPTPMARLYFQIYDWNFSTLVLTEDDKELDDLLEKADDLKDSSENEALMTFGSDYFAYWANSVLQMDDPYRWWIKDSETVVSDLEKADYLVITNDAPGVLHTTDDKSFYDILDIVRARNNTVIFENNAGAIIEFTE